MPENQNNFRWKSIRQGVVLVLIMGALFWGIRSIGTERLRILVEAAGVFAPVAYILLRGVASFVPFASGPLQLASGILFGFVPAILYSVIGSTLGYSVSFWLARRYGRPLVARFVGDAMGQVDRILDRLDSVWGLMTARFVFYFAYDVVAYAAGLSRAKYGSFLMVTFLLGIPPTALTITVGLIGGGVLNPLDWF